MNTSEVLQLIQSLKETGFKHIDVSHEGSHILLSNAEYAGAHIGNQMSEQPLHFQSHPQPQMSGQPNSVNKDIPSVDESVSNELEAAEPVQGGHIVESPIVGTFYAAAGPDSDDFVSVGSVVKQGDVLCIIEAMKLMNEIEADQSGQIAEILVNNEDGVEYGQPLYRIV